MKILLTWKLFPWFKASLSGISPAILLRFCSPAVPDNCVGLCKKRSGTAVILKPKKRKNIFYLTWLVLFIWQILLFWDEMLLFWFTDQFLQIYIFYSKFNHKKWLNISKLLWYSHFDHFHLTKTSEILTLLDVEILFFFVGNHSKSWRPESDCILV